MRVPRDPAAALSPRALEIGILNRIGRAARRQTRGRKVRIPDRTVGILDAGRLTPERLVSILKDVENVTELVCHPGIGDRELENVYRWGYGWDGETAALCDPGVRKAIREGGIEVRGFSGLEGGRVPSLKPEPPLRGRTLTPPTPSLQRAPPLRRERGGSKQVFLFD